MALVFEVGTRTSRLQDENSLIVCRGANGQPEFCHWSDFRTKPRAGRAPLSETDWVSVIERAQAHADEMGIPNVYVVRE